MNHLLRVLVLVGCLVWQVAEAKPRTARPRRELLPPERGPSTELIFDSGLLEKSLSAANMYEKGQQYYEEVHIKRFRGPVLGYVTPWHRKGYDNAVLFRAKLTHVAPVWLQLKRKDQAWVLEGAHEHNSTWIDQVRAPVPGAETATTTRVVPRVIVELTTPQDHVAMVSSEAAKVAELIAGEVQSKDYDGIVLEVWMTWVHMNGMANEEFASAALSFVRGLHTRLHATAMGRPRELILAVPPAVPQAYQRPYTDKKHMRQISPWVDFWSLMTYDYAISAGPRPNSPLPWLQSQIKLLTDSADGGPALGRPEQALMGVNFYGYDFELRSEAQPEAIPADDYIKLLKAQPQLDWNNEEGEHSFDYKAATGRHRVYYPTPRSLELRLELFQHNALGVSIWELGQGLERFFDLL